MPAPTPDHHDSPAAAALEGLAAAGPQAVAWLIGLGRLLAGLLAITLLDLLSGSLADLVAGGLHHRLASRSQRWQQQLERRWRRRLPAVIATLGGLGVMAAATLPSAGISAAADAGHRASRAGGQLAALLATLGGTDQAGAGDPAPAAATPAAKPGPGPAAAPAALAAAPPAVSSGALRAAMAAARRGAIPVGRGMWLYQPERSEGGDPAAIAGRAVQAGLTHLYVRTGSTVDGFYAQAFLDRLLPVAHRAGLRVFGWDFPYLKNADEDVGRAVAAIGYVTPSGDRIDGLASDIEPAPGVNLSPGTAATYSTHLRASVGAGYPLIATVPRPSVALTRYPFAEIVAPFDAVAPMVYWLGNDPGATLAAAMAALAPLGRPVIPVGQAYDAAGEGGPAGVPGRAQIQQFMDGAEAGGAWGVSFWSWQAATPEVWDAVRDSPDFAPPAATGPLDARSVRTEQRQLSAYGYPVPITGVVDPATAGALAAFQQAAGLKVDGRFDRATVAALRAPAPPPRPH